MSVSHNFNSKEKSIPAYRDKNLQIIFLITLIAVMGVSSITPAFPRIARELGISKQSVGLLIIFFTLPAVVLTPVLGVMADRYGRKNVLIPSLILFGIAGGICTLVRKFELLLVLRFFQGVGAASLGSINVTLIGDIFTGKRRTQAMGYNSSVLSVATASYPFLGGLLASAGWYYPFILPVFAVPVAVIVVFKLRNPEPGGKQNLKQYLVAAFKAIKTRQVFTYFFASFGTFIILYGSYLTYFPFLLENTHNASPFVIGLMMSSMSAVTAITSSQLGKISRLFDIKNLLKISFILYSLSLLTIPLVSDIWMLFIPLFIFGLAHGMNIPCIQILLAGIAPIEYRAAFMSLNGMVLRLGQTLGPILMGAMFIMGGLSYPFYAGAIVCIIVFSLLVALIK
jgi:ACDE family multidrug resistance protein